MDQSVFMDSVKYAASGICILKDGRSTSANHRHISYFKWTLILETIQIENICKHEKLYIHIHITIQYTV